MLLMKIQSVLRKYLQTAMEMSWSTKITKFPREKYWKKGDLQKNQFMVVSVGNLLKKPGFVVLIFFLIFLL